MAVPRDQLLDLTHEIVEGVGILALDGELIAETRFEPERVLRGWLEQEQHRVIIEFSRVNHIDSAGLSILLGALHRFRRHGGDMLLVGLHSSLDAIFEVTSMERYFKIFPSLDEARRHFDSMG